MTVRRVRFVLSLRMRTMLGVAIVVTLILVLDAFGRRHMERDRGVEMLTERAGLLASLEAAGLSVALWNLDKDQISAALDAVAADPDFKSVILLRPDGSTFGTRVRTRRSDELPGSRQIEETRQVRYTDHGITQTIGTLRITLDTVRLEQVLSGDFVGEAAPLTVLLGAMLFVMWAATRHLVRLLDLLTTALRRLAQGELDTPLPALDRADEIGEVARALLVFRDTAHRLTMAEGQYRALFDHAALGIFGADEHLGVTSVNAALLMVTGCPDRQAIVDALANGRLYVRAERRDELGKLVLRDGGYAGEVSEFRRPDGSTCWVSETVRSFKDEAGRVLGYTGTVEDITDRMRLQSEERLRVHAAMRSASDAILIVDEDGRTVFANPAFEAAFGTRTLCSVVAAGSGLAGDGEVYGEREDRTAGVGEGGVGSGLPEMMADAGNARALLRALRTGEPWQGEADIGSPPSGTVPMLIRASAIRDEHGGHVGSVVICTDLTLQRAAEARIRHMAHFDTLTGLPNRALFGERLAAALDRVRSAAGDTTADVALLCLDLDRFKDVNDTLGHGAGDKLLQAVAVRLGEAVRPGDMVARLGGDEFVVLQAASARAPSAEGLAARLIGSLSEPYTIDGRQVCIGVSVGIALAPLHSPDADQLMRFGDMALYHAKAQGRGRAQIFSPGLDQALRQRTELERDLRRAVDRQALHLHYQPQFSLVDGRLCGAEALLRWQDPARGAVSPAEFIPVAEESGLINTLGEWVLRTACRDAAGWANPLSVAVNLSPVQFGTDLVALVAAVLQETGLHPARLELEITEGVLMGDAEPTLAMLAGLKALGVRIAMDDFGTGYSSLSYLRRMPIDKLKIDQSFVRALGHDGTSLALVRSIVGLARDLGIDSLAEGVETEAQAGVLRAEGCLEVQGYLFGRPMPAAAFAALATGRSMLARVA